MKNESLLNTYLRRLGWSLSSMPADDREDIVAEARSHLQDKVDRGTRLEDAIADLGLPQDYAREFINERQLVSALGTRDSMGLLTALGQRAVRSARTIVASAGAAIVWILTILVCGVAAAKIFDPSHVGLWMGHDLFFLGTLSNQTIGREVLGLWIFPIAAIALLVARFTCRHLSLWALRPFASAKCAATAQRERSEIPKSGDQ